MAADNEPVVPLTTSLPLSLARKLRDRAKAEGRTQAWYVRKGLEIVLAERPERGR